MTKMPLIILKKKKKNCPKGLFGDITKFESSEDIIKD
jgi:hypothetical protein